MDTKKILIINKGGGPDGDIQDRLESLGYRVVGVLSSVEEIPPGRGNLDPDLIILQGADEDLQPAAQDQNLQGIPFIFLINGEEKPIGETTRNLEPFRFTLTSANNRELMAVIELTLSRNALEKAEKALGEMKEQYEQGQFRFKTLVENAPVGLMLIEKEGSFQYLNPKFTEIFGYDPADIPSGKEWFAKAYPDPRLRKEVVSGWIKDFQAPEKKTMGPRTYWVTCKDGAQKLIQFHSVKGEHGEAITSCQDITEIHRFEEQNRNWAEKYRTILELTGEGYYENDLSGNITHCNDAYCTIMGYSRNELMGMNYKRLMDGDSSISRIYQLFNQVFLDGIPVIGHDMDIIRKDGQRRIVDTSVSLVKDPSGKATGFRGMIRDMTERRLAERALLESEEKFRTLAETTEAGILIHREGKHLYVNTGALKIFGYSLEEMKAMFFWEPLDPTIRDLVRKRAADRLEGKPLSSLTPIKIITNGGKERWVVTSAALIQFEGKPAILVTLIDVDDQKKAEEALEAEKERLVVTLRSIGDGVITTDTEGRITLINSVAEQLTGWSQEEALSRPLGSVFRIIQEKTRQIAEDPVAKVLQTGQTIGLANHTSLIARDGTERTIADSGAPIKDHQGQIIGVVLVFRDITERKKLDAERLKSSKLESMGILAGGIAHDFNNLLTGILGNISLAKLNIAPQNPASRNLEETEKAVFRAKELTHQLLTFSKGGAPILKPAYLTNLLKDTVRFALSGTSIEWEFNLEPDLFPAEIDEGQISQVVHNIIINAQQAMPQGGIVRLTTRNRLLDKGSKIPFPGFKSGRYIEISLQDQGMGISPANLNQIFDPYFTTKKEGSGLGLATAYSVIRNHNGYITVESELNQGTTFSIYLPASSNPIIVPEEPVESLERGQGRILVMDDEEIVRNVAAEILEHLGYEVKTASEGSEAIELFRQAQETKAFFSAVILDLTIRGGLGGKETIENLLKIDPQVVALVSSGYSDDPIMANFEEYGFKGMISKPYKIKDVQTILSAVLKARPKNFEIS